ncbi:hypothetical protein Dimus_037213 [Dionaea muscipula]
MFIPIVSSIKKEMSKHVVPCHFFVVVVIVLIMQEEVLERAKRAKEKAAREAIEEQGFIPSPAVTNYSSQVKSSDTSRSSSSSAHDAATATPTVSSSSTAVNIDGRPTFNTDQDNADQDPLSGLSTDRLM